MASGAIVESLDVEKDICHRCHTSLIKSMIDRLSFQRTKETFCRSIVIAIALAAHAGCDVIVRQKFLEIIACVLAATVAVMNQRASRLTLIQRHLQSIDDQLFLHARIHGPTDNASRKQIENDSQVEPTFLRGNVGDVGAPFFVRPVRLKVTLQLVWRRLMVRIGFSRALVALRLLDHEPFLAHQAPYPVFSARDAFILQYTPNTFISVCFSTVWRGTLFDEERDLPPLLEAGDRIGPLYLHSTKAWLAMLFDDHSSVEEQTDQVEPYLEAATGALDAAIVAFVFGLRRARELRELPADTDREHSLREYIDFLERSARHAPINFAHKLSLVRAEVHRARGEVLLAMQAYEKASQGARENGYPSEAGLAHALAAEFFQDLGLHQAAFHNLEQVAQAWRHWALMRLSKT